MKQAVIRAPFDPITQHELDWINEYRRAHFLDGIILEPGKEGTVSAEIRLALLSKAVRPFRKLRVSLPTDRPCITLPEALVTEERTVRQGSYGLAAQGIRTVLVKEGWYFECAVDALCKPKRAYHSRMVADVCVMLAKAHGLDEHQAWCAGILHDITKAWSDEQGERLLKVYEPSAVHYDPKVYHSFTAPVFLKTVMGMQDHAVLEAIRTHTLGNGHSELDYILYIADKIEPSRGYDVSEETALAKQDLKAGFELVFKEAEEYRKGSEK